MYCPQPIKHYLPYALGGLVGGITGYLAGSLIVDQIRKHDEEMQWAREEEEEEARLRMEQEGLEAQTELKAAHDDYPVPPAEDIPAKSNGNGNPVDYTSPSKHPHTQEEKAKLEDLASHYTSKEEMKTPNHPIIIPIESYANEHLEYGKETITYYEEDTTYADSNEDIIEDPGKLFGANIHTHFGEDSDDPDSVYVRNPKLGMDYEIIRMRDSYQSAVMGEEKPKTTKPKSSRKKVSKKDDTGEEE